MLRIASVLFLLLAWPGIASAQRLRAEDRLLVTRFAPIDAITAVRTRVVAATPAGLIAFRDGNWEAPLGVPDGFPPNARATALAWDDLSDAAVFATSTGAMYRASFSFRRIEPLGSIGEPVLQLVYSQDDPGLFAHTRRGWQRFRSGGMFAEPVADAELPLDVRVHIAADPRADPFLAATLGALSDPAGAVHRASAVTASDRRNIYWIGTDRGALVRQDTRSQSAEWHAYGLASVGTGAIGGDAEIVWFGNDGGPDGGSAIMEDGVHVVPLPARIHGGPRDLVLDIATAHNRTWFAGLDGVYILPDERFGPQLRPGDWRRVDVGGIAATAFAPTDSTIWIATVRGVVEANAEGTVVRELGGLRATRTFDLALAGDTLWIASERGLWALPPAAVEPQLVVRGGFVAVVATGGDLLAASNDALHSRNNAWAPDRRPGLAGLGELLRIATDEGLTCLAAERGIACRDAPDAPWLYLAVPADIPAGPVTGIFVTDHAVMLGTPAGALFLARTALR